MAIPFSAFIDIESASGAPEITGPAQIHHKSPITAPSPLELDEFEFGIRYTGPSETPKSGHQTPHNNDPQTPNPLLASRPPTPRADEAVSFVPSFSNPPMNKWRVLSCCLIYFGNGMNDSAPGALIPYVESDYNIGYATVALIFVSQAIGFIATAFFIDWLSQRLGRARTLMLAEAVIIAGYIMIITTPPFGVVVVAYLCVGLGESTNLALNNVFCANMVKSTVILGAVHGSYGVGGIVAPIAATALVSKSTIWSRFFLITVGIRLICVVFAGWAFWGYEKEAPSRLLSALERTASRRAAAEAGEPSKIQLLKRALKNRVTLIGALFIFAYQGAEVSISGWVISYLIEYRHGNPAHVGYVTAGFWAGITAGRFILSHLAHRVGERLFTYFLVGGAIAFQLLVWFVPNVIGDAVAVAIVGLLLGPVYPCAQTIFTRLLPRNVQTTAISFVSSAGSSGGAVAPFMTGLLAQAVGTYVLHPVCIVMFALMLGCWFLLPKVPKRVE